MSRPSKSPRIVAKESVGSLSFPPDEVLITDEQLDQRKKNLEIAVTLGNLEHQKVRIFFQDSEAFKMVETTIWALTPERILLKGGVSIPVHRIFEVQVI